VWFLVAACTLMAGESAWMQAQHAFASFFDIIVESKFRAERAPG
jgi:CTP:molybdopterin cytidylyltransferase MocA